MGSTYVQFSGQGFEATDACIEVWLALLVREIDALEKTPDWLGAARAEWHLQATAGLGFGVMPQLDRFVIDDGRKGVILALCRGALSRLEAMGQVLSASDLNALAVGGEGACFIMDVPAEAFVRTATYFTKLLGGTLGSSEFDARFPSPPSSPRER